MFTRNAYIYMNVCIYILCMNIYSVYKYILQENYIYLHVFHIFFNLGENTE